MIDTATLNANELVSKLKSGEISSVELCKAYIKRIEKFDKDVQGLRALIKMCEDLEKEQHEKADRLIKQINGENAFYWRAN